MTVTSSIETGLIPFTSFPFFVKISEPFVNFEIVKSDIGKNLFLDFACVSGGSDTVLSS